MKADRAKLLDENQRLLTELGNLTAENQKVRADYATVLESSTAVTNKLREEVQDLRSQLEVQKTSWDELREELENSETIRREVQAKLTAALTEPSKIILGKQKEELAQLRLQLSAAHADRDDLKIQLSDLKQKSAAAGEFPDAADLLNQLKKAKGKKAGASLADVEKILEILGGGND